jgi:hypothetical protein
MTPRIVAAYSSRTQLGQSQLTVPRYETHFVLGAIDAVKKVIAMKIVNLYFLIFLIISVISFLIIFWTVPMFLS